MLCVSFIVVSAASGLGGWVMEVITECLVIIGAIFNLVSMLVLSETFQPKQIHEDFGRIGDLGLSIMSCCLLCDMR